MIYSALIGNPVEHSVSPSMFKYISKKKKIEYEHLKIKVDKKEQLEDVLKSLEDLDMETETGDYGEYIISINDKKQENNYYWNYYINGEYAPVGVSSYKIKENDVYTFKLEKFE